MKETIKKVIYNKLRALPDNKALLWPDFQVAFDVATGQSLNDCLDEVQVAADELESAQFARFEKLPNGMLRILKGIDFDKWEASMNPKQESQVNIGSVNAQNVQVGNENTINFNVTPEQFVEALNKMNKDSKKSKSVLKQLNSYVKKGVGMGELIKKLVTLIG